jgi:hypothetical protein
METGEILRQIRRCGAALPLEALAAAMDRPEDVIPGLLEILASAKSPLFLETHYVAVVSALYLLAAFRCRSAAPALTELFAPPEGTPSALDDDEVLFEDLGRIFASIYQGDVEAIRKLVERRGASCWIRNSGIISLAIAARAGHGSRDDIAAYCGRLIAGGIDRLLPEERDALAGCVVELRLDEFAEQIDRALAEGLIDRIYVRDSRELAVSEPTPLIEEVSEELEDWYMRWAYGKNRVMTERRGPGIGRNDPCPCGSGRKWKKCCGR